MKRERDNFLHKKFLSECQLHYESGQRNALIVAILWCIQEGLPPSPWLRNECKKAWRTVKKSWDEVFGPPFPKGKHWHYYNRNLKIGDRLKERIEFLHEKEGRSITPKLFKDVGKEFGVSGSTASDIYYETKEEIALLAAIIRTLGAEFEDGLRRGRGNEKGNRPPTSSGNFLNFR